LNGPHNRVKDELASGTARPSFVASNVDRPDLTPEQDDIVKWAAAAMYGAGADTTAGSIYNFILCMTLHPEVQSRAQAEIDSVLGTDTLPTLADRGRLPYVEALILEVFRWGQVVPTGVPHATSTDDVHRGYFIPKGSIIIPNIWRFTHDPRAHRNPYAFDPERFLGPKPEQDPRAYVFGFGRRVCPGQQLAEASMFLACTSMLATLTISKARDVAGNEIVPEARWEGVLITYVNCSSCHRLP
jgi:cytochrome P450